MQIPSLGRGWGKDKFSGHQISGTSPLSRFGKVPGCIIIYLKTNLLVWPVRVYPPQKLLLFSHVGETFQTCLAIRLVGWNHCIMAGLFLLLYFLLPLEWHHLNDGSLRDDSYRRRSNNCYQLFKSVFLISRILPLVPWALPPTRLS